MKPKVLYFLKKSAFSFPVIWAGTFVQVYWAMGFLSDNSSSSCLDCSFVLDTVFLSILTAIVVTPVFILISGIKKGYLQFGLQFLLLSSVWFFWDYTDFVERESSWSTYLFEEEIHATVYHSFSPILVMSVAVVFILNYRYFVNKNEKH